MEGKKIFKSDMLDEIQQCGILDTDHKSYIINSYVINEFNNIIDQFGDKIKETDTIRDKVNLLDRINEKNKQKYTINDRELVKYYKSELNDLLSTTNLDLYSNTLLNIKDINDIKRLNPKMNKFIKYNELFSDYKLLIDYSKLSDRLYIDRDLQSFYYKSKELTSGFYRKKSEYIFNSLRVHLNNINNVIYDFDDNVIVLPRNWKIGESLYKSLAIVQYALNDIRYYYPNISYACDSIEAFITKIIIAMSNIHNIFLYLFPRSLKQIKQAYKCDSDRLVSVIMRSMKPNITAQFVKNFIAESIDREKDDDEIYKALRQYAHNRSDNKSFVREKRAKSRIRQLEFLFQFPQYKKLRLDKSFRYIDIGGDDGSITRAVGKHMGLTREDIINADVDDWVDKSEYKYNDITYIQINKTGRLPFSDNSFSLVTAFQVFHHIEDIHDRMQEIRRITKSGGLLVVREHDSTNSCIQIMADIEHSLFEMTTKDKPSPTFLDTYRAFYMSAEQWTSIIESYGFKCIKNVDYKNDMRIQNPTRSYNGEWKKVK